MISIFVIIFISNSGKVFFKQERQGKNGKVFKVIKFKTMNDNKSKDRTVLPGAERLTQIARFIRFTSLDELLILLNVFKGDMSLIGPRPLLTSYLHLYDEFQNRRHEIKPGITGWAQVNGRNAISWDEKFKLDVWYVDNMSLMIDIKILFKTALKVFVSDGINAANVATTEPFSGKQYNKIKDE
jgi:lipopolysaccharide/colanic/teichoic acid biosynthesis glycosyltransferase